MKQKILIAKNLVFITSILLFTYFFISLLTTLSFSSPGTFDNNESIFQHNNFYSSLLLDENIEEDEVDEFEQINLFLFLNQNVFNVENGNNYIIKPSELQGFNFNSHNLIWLTFLKIII